MIALKTYKEITAYCFGGKIDFQIRGVDEYDGYYGLENVESYEVCHFLEYRKLILNNIDYWEIPDFVKSLMKLGILVTPMSKERRAMTEVDRASLFK